MAEPGRVGRRTVVLGAAALPAAALAAKAVQLAAEPGVDKGTPSILPTPIAASPTNPPGADALRWRQRGGTIDDASWLDRTAVFGVVEVREADDVHAALAFARAIGLKITPAGARHSMGGHAFRHGGVVLDMTRFNRMSLDPATKVLTVQTGATWHDIQSYLHPRFAVKAMQSTDIFTVGGSIAVNAHGMDHRAGSVGSTVRAMRVMLPDGSLREVSRNREPELFRLIVGGYGLFGIVLEADLDVVDNVLYASERRLVDYRDFPRLFREELAPDPTLGLMYGHLSTAPESFLAETMLFLYRQVDGPVDSLPPLKEAAQVRLRRLVFNLSKIGGPAMTLKWFAEKNVEPHVEACMPRQQALTDGCVVSRNEPMHDSVPYLRNSLRGETDILQEYFVPRDRFVAFVDESREILRRAGPTLMNYSVRVVHREDVALTYARDDAFAIVLYLNQRTDDAGNAAMRDLTRQMIDLSAKHGGTFFLPYQLHYTADQLRRAYPQIADVFAAKRRLDPDELLTNTWYETYRQ